MMMLPFSGIKDAIVMPLSALNTSLSIEREDSK